MRIISELWRRCTSEVSLILLADDGILSTYSTELAKITKELEKATAKKLQWTGKPT